jgi:hypothetical protein
MYMNAHWVNRVLYEIEHVSDKLFIDDDSTETLYNTFESVKVVDGKDVDVKPDKDIFNSKWKELLLKDLRAERDRRLAATDWVTLKAYSTSTPVPEAWATYMQALRDLPATTEDPKDPEWPAVPA